MRFVVPLAVVFLAGCAAGPHPNPPPAGRSAMGTETSFTVVEERPGPPPLLRLFVDAELHVDGDAPVWVVIPRNLPYRGGGTDRLEQLTAGHHAIGRLLGTGGCWVLRVAPPATIHLRHLEIDWWRHDSDPIPALPLQLARDVHAGTEPLARWFDRDPTLAGDAVIDMNAAHHTASHATSDGREVPLAIDSPRSIPVQLARSIRPPD